MYICHNKQAMMTGSYGGAKAKQKKATKVEMAQRLLAVYTMLLRDASRAEIIAHAQENWGVGEDSADSYIFRVKGDLEKAFAAERSNEYQRHILMRRDLLRRTQNAGDLRLEHDILKDDAKLLGLYPAAQMDVTSGGEPLKGYVGISPDDWDGKGE